MPSEYEPSESERIDTMDEHDSTNATLPDSESSPDALENEAQVSEGSDSVPETPQTYETISQDIGYTEQVATYLDYINSGLVCTVVLLGAILGVLVVRTFLDKVVD